MPLFLEPNQEFPIALESDMDKPEATRPVFLCKSLAGGGQIKLGEFLDLERVGTISEILDVHATELMKHCVGWRNIPAEYPFGKESMITILGYQEMREILRKVLSNTHVKPEEKKS